MRETDADPLRILNACACSVTIAPSETKHSGAGLGLFAERTFQRSEDTASYYGRLVYHELSSGEHTERVYTDGVLEVDVGRVSKYALPVEVQGRAFERFTARPENKESLSAFLAFLVRVHSLTTSAMPKKMKGTISSRRVCWRTIARRMKNSSREKYKRLCFRK